MFVVFKIEHFNKFNIIYKLHQLQSVTSKMYQETVQKSFSLNFIVKKVEHWRGQGALRVRRPTPKIRREFRSSIYAKSPGEAPTPGKCYVDKQTKTNKQTNFI